MATKNVTKNNSMTGKKVSQETSILTKLYEMTKTKPKAYYIAWKYAPQILPNKSIKTFEDLHSNYQYFTYTMTEAFCETWLTENVCQNAVRWLLNRLHQQKLIELYNMYFEKAKEDTQAFKAFIEFSDKFFADEKESELLSILNGTDIPEDEEEK